MKNLFSAGPKPLDSWQRLLMLGWLRRLTGRPLPAHALLALAVLVLAVYSLGAYALTIGLFGSYAALDLSVMQSAWFITSIYTPTVPLLGALLAYSFPPVMTAPPEAIAALPISPPGWYLPQLRRFVVGIAAVSIASWASVIFAFAHIFQLPLTLTLSLQVGQIAANALMITSLVLVIAVSVFAKSASVRQVLPLAYALVMAALVGLARSKQNTTIREYVQYQVAHPWLVLTAAAYATVILILAAKFELRRFSLSAGSTPLTLATTRARSALLSRLLPVRGGQLPALAVATLRGLARDRKNIVVLATSFLLFIAFAGAARFIHSPVLGSLILSSAAAYFPIFLGIILIFARSWLGPHSRSIYALPLRPAVIAGVQFATVSLAAAVVAILLLVVLLAVVGNHMIPSELAGIALGAALTAGTAYLCGSVMRTHSDDQLSVLGAIAGLFLLQGALFSLQSQLHLSSLAGVLLKLTILALIGLASIAVERFVHQKFRVRHA
jgi:hypothetical protein